jgi:ribose/xylose/arabinose/galactoside ABC-type transport system permease subunit
MLRGNNTGNETLVVNNNDTNSKPLARRGSFEYKKFFSKYGIVFVLLILILALSIISPTFLSVANIMNVLRQIAINGFLAVGMTFVILTGGIDLSVGSVLAFSGVIAATLAKTPGVPIIVPVIAGIVSGLVLGTMNGFVISRFKLAPFIVTLGMMSIARGLTFVYSDGRPIPGLSKAFLKIGGGSIFGIPNQVIILLLVFIIANIILTQTKFGRYIYAIGGNEVSAVISGLNTKRVKMWVYSISGILSGLAGVILTSRVTSGLPQAGQSYELDAIAAVVIGGTSMTGGKGKLWGTIIGILLIGTLNNGMDLLNVSSFYQLIVKGLIIVLAVLLDEQTNKMKA